MTTRTPREIYWTTALATLGCALVAGQGTAAERLENKKVLDSIIGSQVQQEQKRAEADPGRIIAAIENAAGAASEVRKTSSLEKVDIVFLLDAAEGRLPPKVDATVRQHQKEITQLRQELEGNAMLYHAIDSRSVLMRDVIAVEFDGHKSVIIYAAARPSK